MAVTVTYSDQYLKETANGDVHLDSDNIRVALMNASFSFSATTHITWTSVASASELTAGSGYTQITASAGAAVSNVSTSSVSTSSASTHVLNITADNEVWTASGSSFGSPASAVLVDFTSSASGLVLWHTDFGGTYAVPNGKSFTLNFSAGLLDIS